MWTTAVMSVLVSVSTAQPLVTNGDFEHTGASPGPRLIGKWQIVPSPGSRTKPLAPVGWELNRGFPGELAVLAQGGASGKHCIRIRGTGKGEAHIFQACKALRAGRWYKVSFSVRDGKVSLWFYEYRKGGRFARSQRVCTYTAPPGAWRRATAWYSPSLAGFGYAALALVVPQGGSAVIDHVTIGEVATPAAGRQPVTLENGAVRLVISGGGRLRSLVSKASGKDYAAPGCPLPLVRATRDQTPCPLTAIRRDGDVLKLRFLDADVTASIKVTGHGGYSLFEVLDVQPADVTSLELAFPVKRLATWAWAMDGTHDSEFGICHMAVTPNTLCRIRRVEGGVTLSASWYRAHGFRGAKSVLVATPFNQYLTTIQRMERDTGLPCPVLDGKWARLSEPVRRSYLFVTDYADGDLDALIRYAKVGHFGLIMFRRPYWRKSTGHYGVNERYFPGGLDALKQACDKIHTAGFGVGLHLFGPSITKNDAYVTPVPDERLMYVTCPPLAHAVDAKTTTLTLTGPADLPAPQHTKTPVYRHPGHYVRVGDEVIHYSDIKVGPPYRFTGCLRGAIGTRAVAHPAGTRVRSLLAMGDCFLFDPDSTLVGEVTRNLARVVNTCKIDMVYFDGCGVNSRYFDAWYYMNTCLLAHYRAFDHDLIFQTSYGAGRQTRWHFIPRSASADGHGNLKWYLDQRLNTILGMENNFCAADVGWYGLDMHWTPDQLEYVAAKCLGADGSISVQATRRILETHPRAREIMEMLGRYERCRLADHFPASVKQKLLEKEKDFRLYDDGRGGWTLCRAAYDDARRVAALDGKANVWTVTNDLDRPCRATVAVTRRRGQPATPADHNRPDALALADFRDVHAYDSSQRNQYAKYVLGGRRTLSPEGPVSYGVTQRFTGSANGGRRGGPCAVYSATNTDRFNGWGGRGKRFGKPVDLSGYPALGLWVHGDGQGETFFFQLRDAMGRCASFHVPVHFTGWQFWSFARTGPRRFDWKRVDYLIFYLINVPSGKTVAVRIGHMKALSRTSTSATIENVEIAVGDQRLRIAAELAPGQCLTTDGLGACTFWPGGMKPGCRITVPGAALVLQPGPNRVTFGLGDPKAYTGDISVRICRMWPLEE